jgi:hypothetical protein
MPYILIFVFLYGGESQSSAQSVKFQSLKACQAAATEIRKQAVKHGNDLPILVCAAEHL